MKRIDQHKAFPYVAWVLFIGFALFTYNLTTQVAALEETSNAYWTEAAIDDVERYFDREE